VNRYRLLYITKNPTIILKILCTTAQNLVAQDLRAPDLVYWTFVRKDKYIRILKVVVITYFKVLTPMHLKMWVTHMTQQSRQRWDLICVENKHKWATPKALGKKYMQMDCTQILMNKAHIKYTVQ
jgi:hypothetical protein